MKTDSTTKNFRVDIVVEEDENQTEAKASVDVAGTHFGGWGRAKRNPSDPEVRRIGEDLAIARALNDLSHQLLDAAVEDISAFEHGPVDAHL